MKKPEISFVDFKSIIVINPAGKMRQLFVPFRVQVILDTNSLKKGTWVIVEEVQPHIMHILIYRIGSNWWQFDLFRIAVVF
jgi:hypothetical protein